MQRHLVVRHLVHGLHDVDLAALGPVLALGPEAGPHGAAVRQVGRVHDEDAADGEVVLRGDAHLREREVSGIGEESARG